MVSPAEVRYARTDDGIDVAYVVTGSGPCDVLVVHGFTTHLDLMWDSPWHVAWARALGEHFRVIHFDKRGAGLSDRSLGQGSIEQRTRDLVAVLDAVESERAHVVSISEGAAMSLVLAASAPERINRVVIYGGFGRVMAGPDYPGGYDEASADLLQEWMVGSWGTGEVFGRMMIESPEEVIPTFAHFERNACSRQMVEQFIQADREIDVLPILRTVSAPTLVIHNADDPAIPAAWGRALADGIPAARYLELDGAFHCTSYLEKALPIIKTAVDFLLGDAPARPPVPTRTLATVLFTDIVDSTACAADAGDAAWREVLEQHDAVTRTSVEGLGGRLVKFTGDGMLAIFDGPTRGIDCARAIQHRMRPLGIDVRAGVHTGEIEHRGDDIGGIGVHIAARVAGLAGAGEVLVSRTVRDLVLGSDLQLHERGPTSLKGVPGEWELFAVGSPS